MLNCTHTFSSTQIEEDELFYLRSRGIEKNKAIKILLMSFVGKILNKIDQPSLKKTYARRFSNF